MHNHDHLHKVGAAFDELLQSLSTKVEPGSSLPNGMVSYATADGTEMAIPWATLWAIIKFVLQLLGIDLPDIPLPF